MWGTLPACAVYNKSYVNDDLIVGKFYIDQASLTEVRIRKFTESRQVLTWSDPVGSSQGKDNLGHYHLDRQIFHQKCHLGQRLDRTCS